MSRLDEMVHDCESVMTAARGIVEILNNTRSLAESNIEQASEIGSEIVQRLNGEVCDASDTCIAKAEELSADLANLYHTIQNAGG